MTYQGKLYRVISVRDNSVRNAQQVVGLRYYLTVLELPQDNLTLEQIVEKRHGLPGESFTQTVERLLKGETHA